MARTINLNKVSAPTVSRFARIEYQHDRAQIELIGRPGAGHAIWTVHRMTDFERLGEVRAPIVEDDRVPVSVILAQIETLVCEKMAG